jgi:hypothetical protein
VDGQYLAKKPLNPGQTIPGRTLTIQCLRVAFGEKMYLAFGKNQTTDDKAAACKDETLLTNLGTIRVEVRETTYTYKGLSTKLYSRISSNVFDEKTKKGLIKHAVKGVTRKCNDSAQRSSYQHGVMKPMFTFTFRYRSLDWLQAEDYVAYQPWPDSIARSVPVHPPASSRIKPEKNAKCADNEKNAGPVYIDLTED